MTKSNLRCFREVTGFKFFVFAAAFILTNLTPVFSSADNCLYVPDSVDLQNHMPKGQGEDRVKGVVHLIRSKGCRPQCIGRVYCADPKAPLDPKLVGNDLVKAQIKLSKLLSVDPNYRNEPKLLTCPKADDAMADYKAKKAVEGKLSPISTEGDTVVILKVDKGVEIKVPVEYLADAENGKKKVTTFDLPAAPVAKDQTAPATSCSRCVSPVYDKATMYGFVQCENKGGVCPTAAGCWNENPKDRNNYGMVSFVSDELRPRPAVTHTSPSESKGSSDAGKDAPPAGSAAPVAPAAPKSPEKSKEPIEI